MRDLSRLLLTLTPLIPLGAVDLTGYGYIKVDASYDTDRSNHGDRAFFLLPPSSAETDDDEFTITANQSRLGVKAVGPDAEGMSTSGKIEVDFFEGGAATKPRLRLRYAYIDINCNDWSLRAGQCPDIISPLVTPTINFAVGFYQGNTGFRRPSIFVTRTMGDWQFAAGLSRSLESVGAGAADDNGEDSGLPALQARVAWKHGGTAIGAWTYFGNEEDDTAGEEYVAWVAGLDVSVTINEQLRLQGEVYTGANTNTVLGGIGHGIVGDEEVGATGGWLALRYLRDRWTTNLSFGIDTADEDDGATRTANTHVSVNTWYKLQDPLKVGAELQWLATDYATEDDVDGVRVQFAIQYGF